MCRATSPGRLAIGYSSPHAVGVLIQPVDDVLDLVVDLLAGLGVPRASAFAPPLGQCQRLNVEERRQLLLGEDAVALAVDGVGLKIKMQLLAAMVDVQALLLDLGEIGHAQLLGWDPASGYLAG